MKEYGSEFDEILETLWVIKEDRAPAADRGLKRTELNGADETLNRMCAAGLLTETRDSVNFSPSGEARAREIIRSHRLAERLFVDILDLGEKYVEKNACVFEHILSVEILDSICTLLGHPTQCPHGRAIPTGSCCRANNREVSSIVTSLDTLQYSETGKILYIATRQHDRIDKLSALDIVPGSMFRVLQTMPAHVIKIDETEIALEKEVARDIYVRRLAR